MDKIWYRHPSKSEVIGRSGRDRKKGMITHNRQKSNAKKKSLTQFLGILVNCNCTYICIQLQASL